MSLFSGEPRRPESPSPPIITSPTTATPGLSRRGVKLAVIDSVDNANFPQFATVLVDNKTPGEMGYSLPAGVGPFAAGGTANFQYYYNNSSGIGGSYCYVDCDARLVISFTGNVSDTPPTPFYKALADHLHNGNLDPDSFQNPQPINLSNGEISSILPYGNNSPQVQQVVGTDGALLATTFPGQVKQISSGPYAGYFQLITNTVKDVNPLNCGQTANGATCPWVCVTWQFLTTYSAAGGNFNPISNITSAFGPIIWDSVGNSYWLKIMNDGRGGGSIAGGSPDFIDTGVSGTDPWLNQLHTIQFMMQPLGGGLGHNIAWYVDGLLMTGNTSLQGPQNYTGPFYFGWLTTDSVLYPPTGIYARVFRAEISSPHQLMSTTFSRNWDQSSAQLTNTQSLSGNTMNVTPYITDFTLHYSVNSSATSLTYWFDNGSGGDAKLYNSYDTSGATDINIGHTTSGSPSGTQAVSSGQTWYVMAYYLAGSMHWTLQSTPFTGSQVRNAYADSTVACMASLTTSTSDPSGPISIVANGTGSRSGNGGRTKL